MIIRPPTISVCVPTYNGDKYLSDALASLEKQTFQDFEIIFSDDSSRDNTIELIKEFQRSTKKQTFLFSHKPSGIAANWNNTIVHSNGIFIKFLFQDDILNENCLEKMYNQFKIDNNLHLVFSKRKLLIDSNIQNDKSILDWCYKYSDLQKDLDINLNEVFDGRELLKSKKLIDVPENKIGEPTAVMFKKDVINKVGLFNKNLRQSLDFEFWYRIFKYYKIRYIDEYLCYFRIHNTQTTIYNRDNNIGDYNLYLKILYRDFYDYLHPLVKQILKRNFSLKAKIYNKLFGRFFQYQS